MAVGEHLFVYGTLQRGRSPWAAWLAERADWMGEATVAGWLLDLGAYPGLVAARDGAARVHGEVWRLREESVLEELDRYEGCHATDAAPHEYARVRVTATRATGGAVVCWTYLYQGAAEGAKALADGRW